MIITTSWSPIAKSNKILRRDLTVGSFAHVNNSKILCRRITLYARNPVLCRASEKSTLVFEHKIGRGLASNVRICSSHDIIDSQHLLGISKYRYVPRRTYLTALSLSPYIYGKFLEASMAQRRRTRRAHAREYVWALSSPLHFVLLSRSARTQMRA